jgi:CHAT domain-containing protein
MERAAVLDAQAAELRGVSLLQLGKLDDAQISLESADKALLAIRGGRLNSALWLRSQIAMERATIAETKGEPARANNLYGSAIAILETYYPDTPALLAARARKAGFMARTGDKTGALALFATVVNDSEKTTDSSTALRDLLPPYFALLVEANTPDAAAALFKAAQSLQRPGVASTQAILARELSEGDGEASALFRLAVARTRDIGRTETDLTRLSAITDPSDADKEMIVALRQTLDKLREEQTGLTARLSSFPRYNVLSPTSVPLAELQGRLGEGEAYYKLAIIGDAAYAIYTDRTGASIYRLAQDRVALEDAVARLRDSIVRIENGQAATYPFNIELARALYVTLFGPVTKKVDGVRHLIFEPDGPLLELPPSLLVTDDASVTAYKTRVAKPNADEFDFTGTAWLGRGRHSTIAVSPRAFLDVRAIAPSRAPMAYLGLGNNAPPTAFPPGRGTDGCDWPLGTWQAPISPVELTLARSLIGGSGSKLLTGAAFTDDALMNSGDLAQYRILHFATHGLVTAPKPQCPSRPALVTSFGQKDSDGLLSFREIFDLKIDADLVILSACDTAGMATASASREAGIRTGGNYALDGLVRAFIGAGARSVIASHWPVPDDYDATRKLISGLFGGRPGESIGALLDGAQMGLMDKAATSHPFYWAAFVILGDAEKPLIRQ